MAIAYANIHLDTRLDQNGVVCNFIRRPSSSVFPFLLREKGKSFHLLTNTNLPFPSFPTFFSSFLYISSLLKGSVFLFVFFLFLLFFVSSQLSVQLKD